MFQQTQPSTKATTLPRPSRKISISPIIPLIVAGLPAPQRVPQLIEVVGAKDVISKTVHVLKIAGRKGSPNIELLPASLRIAALEMGGIAAGIDHHHRIAPIEVLFVLLKRPACFRQRQKRKDIRILDSREMIGPAEAVPASRGIAEAIHLMTIIPQKIGNDFSQLFVFPGCCDVYLQRLFLRAKCSKM